jgi:hypothetical protein
MADTNFDSVVANTFTGAFVGPISGAVSATTGAFTGVVSISNGAVGAPALTFTSDTDTGLYRVGANSLALVAGGAAILTADSAGFNGILGGTTPAAATVTALTTSGNVDLNSDVVALGSTATGLTAHAGGGQGSALALTKAVNVVSTVATAADSVKLPAPSFVGQRVTVINAAATNSMQVFGSGTDTINGVATATGVAQAAGKSADYIATSTGTAAAWFRILSA